MKKWQIKYEDGTILDFPSGYTKSEIDAHCIRKNAVNLGIVDDGELDDSVVDSFLRNEAADILREVGLVVNDANINFVIPLNDNPARLRDWIKKMKEVNK